MTQFEDRLKLLRPAPASEGLRNRLAVPSTAGRRDAFRLVPFAVAAAGLLAVVVYTVIAGPARRETPEGAFRRIEETLLKAKSLRVRFHREASLKDAQGVAEKVVSSGTMLLTKENRLQFVLKERRRADQANPVEFEFLYVCDGSRVRTWVKTKDGLKAAPGEHRPDRLERKIVLELTRNSIATPPSFLSLDAEELAGQWPVSGFQAGEDDGGARTMTHRSGPFHVRLWYDPGTHTPMKRVLTLPQIGTITETYEECTLDPEIPDSAFAFPADK